MIGEERTITFTPGNSSTLQQDGTYRVSIEAYGTLDAVTDPIVMQVTFGSESFDFNVAVTPLTPRWDTYEARFTLSDLASGVQMSIRASLGEFQNLYVRRIIVEGPVMERLDCETQATGTVCWLPPDSDLGVDSLNTAVRSPLCLRYCVVIGTQ